MMMFEAPLAHNLLQLRSVCHQMYCLCLPCPTSCGLHPRSNASKLSNSAFTKKVYCVPQGQGALLGTYAGLANQFVTSHAAMRQMQETLVQEQNLFISLLGAVWRRVRTINNINIMIIIVRMIITVISSNYDKKRFLSVIKRLSIQVKGQEIQEERWTLQVIMLYVCLLINSVS